MTDYIKKTLFSDIDFNDIFFDSLKSDYQEIDKWFAKKSSQGEYAYLLKENSNILGFLYLKIEDEDDVSITPYFPKKKRLKIGTFKVSAHGTKVGERFLKLIFDFAIENDLEDIYVTIFPKHISLVTLFEMYGFNTYGVKNSDNGEEKVLTKDLNQVSNNPFHRYPLLDTENNKKHLLAIDPKFHTIMFPDSKLNTEKGLELEDVSHTNSIQKIYICSMKHVLNFDIGDLIIIYRMAEKGKRADFNAVATSIATVVDFKTIDNFSTEDDFIAYTSKFSIFDDNQLKKFWNSKKYPFIIKMVYNVALKKRIIRRKLIQNVGLDRNRYWGGFELSNSEFNKILELGEVHESFIINKA